MWWDCWRKWIFVDGKISGVSNGVNGSSDKSVPGEEVKKESRRLTVSFVWNVQGTSQTVFCGLEEMYVGSILYRWVSSWKALGKCCILLYHCSSSDTNHIFIGKAPRMLVERYLLINFYNLFWGPHPYFFPVAKLFGLFPLFYFSRATWSHFSNNLVCSVIEIELSI